MLIKSETDYRLIKIELMNVIVVTRITFINSILIRVICFTPKTRIKEIRM
jgi:hypothetical protein